MHNALTRQKAPFLAYRDTPKKHPLSCVHWIPSKNTFKAHYFHAFYSQWTQKTPTRYMFLSTTDNIDRQGVNTYHSRRGFLVNQEEYSKNQETSQTRGQSAENLKMPLIISAPLGSAQLEMGMWLKLFRGSLATCVAVTSASFIKAAPTPPYRKR